MFCWGVGRAKENFGPERLAGPSLVLGSQREGFILVYMAQFLYKQRNKDCSHLRNSNFNISINASDMSKCGYRSPIRMLSHQFWMGKLQNSCNSLCISHYVVQTIIPINISPLTGLAVQVILSNPETIHALAVIFFLLFPMIERKIDKSWRIFKAWEFFLILTTLVVLYLPR